MELAHCVGLVDHEPGLIGKAREATMESPGDGLARPALDEDGASFRQHQCPQRLQRIIGQALSVPRDVSAGREAQVGTDHAAKQATARHVPTVLPLSHDFESLSIKV